MIEMVDFERMSAEEKMGLERNKELKSYDFAMPIEWAMLAGTLAIAYGVTKQGPCGHVVWSYDGDKNLFGRPVGIDPI
ncbi:MAG: hypothetical protein KAJ01_02705, partial [Candidatus Hydrogenedentes bacterium]|nr:hypothetical protein [Candidatus Hydrogenedentota bacterium]